jgi:prefoldin subunit 5
MQEILHSFESGSETLSAVRNELEELIQVANNLRAKLAELERRLAAARVSKEQLGQAQAAAEQAAKAHIVLQNACEDLRRRIRELKDQVAALQREINEREGAMLVRPPRGTDKKPTFVDCDKSGIRIMPQGLRLPVKPDGKDYESMTAGADREELLKHARSTGLVLFLVRPDGFASFRAYRACIETCNKSIPGSKTISIGYEPVNSDWKLRYPKE